MREVPQAPPSHFREAESTGGFGGDNEIEEEIMRLEHENKRMKQNLSGNSQTIQNPLKNQLRNELSGLQSQIRQYEAVLKNQSTVGS